MFETLHKTSLTETVFFNEEKTFPTKHSRPSLLVVHKLLAMKSHLTLHVFKLFLEKFGHVSEYPHLLLQVINSIHT